MTGIEYSDTALRDPREDRFFEDLFGSTRVMTIIRGLSADDAVRRAEDAWAHGVRAVEVTIAESAHVAALEAVVQAAHGRGVLVGAGSIYRTAQVALVAGLGVDFTVAPGLSAEVSRACRAAGLPHLPGVASASEVTAAESLGHTWMKAFPARELGASWFRAMDGPFPWAKWIATGGMGVGNAAEFFAAGVRAVGMGARIDDWTKAGPLLGEPVAAESRR